MSTDIRKVKVVLDTNIIISALGFGGKPRQILNLAIENKIQAVSSPVLLAEFEDIVFKKFPILAKNYKKIERQLKEVFKIVKPEISITKLSDKADNRVLEAALEGKCEFIVTGDQGLLELGSFRKTKIVTATEFLNLIL